MRDTRKVFFPSVSFNLKSAKICESSSAYYGEIMDGIFLVANSPPPPFLRKWEKKGGFGAKHEELHECVCGWHEKYFDFLFSVLFHTKHTSNCNSWLKQRVKKRWIKSADFSEICCSNSFAFRRRRCRRLHSPNATRTQISSSQRHDIPFFSQTKRTFQFHCVFK